MKARHVPHPRSQGPSRSCDFLAAGAVCHAPEAISREAAQPTQVLGFLLVLAPITFIFAATGARGRVGRAGVDVACSDHSVGLLAVDILLPRYPLVLLLMLVLVIASRSVFVLPPQSVLVAILVLHLLRTVGDELSLIAALKACSCGTPYVHSVLMHLLEPPGQQR
jgi:hypothetical protein